MNRRLYRYWPLALATFVLAWALGCVAALQASGVAGFTTTGNGLVTGLRPGGPADAAGLRPGDRVVGHREAGTAHAGPPGQVVVDGTRTLRVQRGESEFEVAIRYAERTGVDYWRPLGFIVLGSVVMAIPGFTLYRRPGRLTRILFVAGAGIGLACMGEPDFGQGAWWAGVMAVRHAVVLGGLGALVQFALEFVRPGRRASWVYLPLAAYWLVLDWRLLAPGATALAPVAGVVGGVLLVLSLSVILVAMSRGWIRGRKLNEPPGIGMAFGATIGALALLLASATAQRAWGLDGLVDVAGAVSLLLLVTNWSRAAAIAQAAMIDNGLPPE